MTREELPNLAHIHSIAELCDVTDKVLAAFGVDPDLDDLTEFADLGFCSVLAMWLHERSIRLDHLRYIATGGTIGRWLEDYGEPYPFDD
jgi:hypothetical protein